MFYCILKKRMCVVSKTTITVVVNTHFTVTESH